MSINADPLFIAAEVAWRTESLSHGLATAAPSRHHGRTVRTAIGRVIHPHRHGRSTARAGSARIA